MVEADSHLKLLFAHPNYTYNKCLSTLICCPRAYGSNLNSYTHTTWLIFWGSGSLVESKWCHYVMVEAYSHLKLLPVSTSYISKSLSTLICCPWAYSISLQKLYPHSYFGVLVHLWRWKWCHYVMVEADSQLKLLPTYSLEIYNVSEHIHMLSTDISISLKKIYSHFLAHVVITSWLRLTANADCFLHPH
jgi:hypothetical protein